jgi:hypothetical protein
VAQKLMKMTFPLRSESEIDFPDRSVKVKSGAALSEAKDKIPLVVIANANRRTNTATLFIIISSNNYIEFIVIIVFL